MLYSKVFKMLQRHVQGSVFVWGVQFQINKINKANETLKGLNHRIYLASMCIIKYL